MLDRVYVLVTSPDAKGGIARATTTLVNSLTPTHQVELVCLRRRGGGPRFGLDPAVAITAILDHAAEDERWLEKLPSEVPGGERTGAYSALVDRLLPRYLATLPPSIVISTRAVFHLEIARHAPAHCVTIGQDHVNMDFREAKGSLEPVAQAIGDLDAFVTLTEADADKYRQRFPQAADRLHVIRNPAPWPVLPAVPADRKPIVVAVGKLGGRKGFDRLIEAYRTIAAERPDWQLHIYGSGPQERKLAGLIEEHQLGEHVFLKGQSDRIQDVMEEASIFALSSRYEGLPMVLLEAMTKGLPIVSVDCPQGPSEIVVDGVTGRLVRNDDDMAEFTTALLELIDDPAKRARMAEQSLVHAQQYQPDRVRQNWLDLFEDLSAAKAVPAG